MQLTRPRACAAAALAAVALLALAAGWPAGEAHATVNKMSMGLAGPGFTKRGETLRAWVAVSNRPDTAGLTPQFIPRLEIKSQALRFRPRARGLKTCRARLPRNGDAAACPSRSKVGSGSIAAIIGKPGEEDHAFGSLSAMSGRIDFFNYRRRGGERARLLAVIRSAQPFPGVYANLAVDVRRNGTIEFVVPSIAALPTPMRNAYPHDYSLVITHLRVAVGSASAPTSRAFIVSARAGAADIFMSLPGV